MFDGNCQHYIELWSRMCACQGRDQDGDDAKNITIWSVGLDRDRDDAAQRICGQNGMEITE